MINHWFAVRKRRAGAVGGLLHGAALLGPCATRAPATVSFESRGRASGLLQAVLGLWQHAGSRTRALVTIGSCQSRDRTSSEATIGMPNLSKFLTLSKLHARVG